MEEILHRFYNVDFLQPRTPFLTLALKASKNKFVPMTEILHRLRQNSCQCSKGGAGMRRHVIENAYYVGGARFPPSTVMVVVVVVLLLVLLLLLLLLVAIVIVIVPAAAVFIDLWNASLLPCFLGSWHIKFLMLLETMDARAALQA